MNLTANMSLQLLYIHHCEPSYVLGLTEDEVITLGLEVVSKYSEITSKYKDQLILKDKETLIDFLRKYPVGSPFWVTQ